MGLKSSGCVRQSPGDIADSSMGNISKVFKSSVKMNAFNICHGPNDNRKTDPPKNHYKLLKIDTSRDRKQQQCIEHPAVVTLRNGNSLKNSEKKKSFSLSESAAKSRERKRSSITRNIAAQNPITPPSLLDYFFSNSPKTKTDFTEVPPFGASPSRITSVQCAKSQALINDSPKIERNQLQTKKDNVKSNVPYHSPSHIIVGKHSSLDENILMNTTTSISTHQIIHSPHHSPIKNYQSQIQNPESDMTSPNNVNPTMEEVLRKEFDEYRFLFDYQFGIQDDSYEGYSWFDHVADLALYQQFTGINSCDLKTYTTEMLHFHTRSMFQKFSEEERLKIVSRKTLQNQLERRKNSSMIQFSNSALKGDNLASEQHG